MSDDPARPHVEVRLTADEALVLFDMISRWISDEVAVKPQSAAFEGPAEPVALSCLLGHLETTLVEPFRSDYRQLLAAARFRLTQQHGEGFSFED